MQNKLKTNKNHFSIKELKIAYIKSRVSETAIKHIASCIWNIFLNSFLEVKEVLLIINKMYDDFNHYHMIQQQYLKLYQNKIFFHEFWMKFQRFSAELKYNNEILLDNLQHKISSDLQRATFNK
jgi:biopolymer transport protein ExbB/TolQ